MKFGLSEQPFPVLIGEELTSITKRLVLINDIKYIFRDIIRDICDSQSSFIINSIENKYKNEQNGMKVVADVKIICTAFNNILEKFKTEHNRLQLLQNTTFYLPPREFFIGNQNRTSVKRYSNDTVKLNAQSARGYLFPLRDIFKKFLNYLMFIMKSFRTSEN